MAKTLTLTEDHIKLIKAINFETFDIGEFYNTRFICDSIKDIESNKTNMDKFGTLRTDLIKVKDQLELLSEQKECHAWGINQWNLFGGTFVMEDVALILGHFGDYIPGTEESPMGKQYPKVLEDYFWECYLYIVENIVPIFNLILYYIDKGGIMPGTYKLNTANYNWEKID